MLVIRRMDTGNPSYTAIFLPGESPRIFPTTDQEHARILQIYQQDRPYQDAANDFTDFHIGVDAPPRCPASGKTGMAAGNRGLDEFPAPFVAARLRGAKKPATVGA